MSDTRFVSIPKAAKILGWSHTTTWRAAKAGLLPCIASAHGRLYVDTARLDALSVEQSAARAKVSR